MHSLLSTRIMLHVRETDRPIYDQWTMSDIRFHTIQTLRRRRDTDDIDTDMEGSRTVQAETSSGYKYGG